MQELLRMDERERDTHDRLHPACAQSRLASPPREEQEERVSRQNRKFRMAAKMRAKKPFGLPLLCFSEHWTLSSRCRPWSQSHHHTSPSLSSSILHAILLLDSPTRLSFRQSHPSAVSLLPFTLDPRHPSLALSPTWFANLPTQLFKPSPSSPSHRILAHPVAETVACLQ